VTRRKDEIEIVSEDEPQEETPEETSLSEETAEEPQEETPEEVLLPEEIVQEAEEIVFDAPVAPIELVVASDNPLTDEPTQKDAKPDKAIRSHVTVVYVGNADSFSYGPYKFRPGQPAIMPSVIAEELLTYPFEKFEVKE